MGKPGLSGKRKVDQVVPLDDVNDFNSIRVTDFFESN